MMTAMMMMTNDNFNDDNYNDDEDLNDYDDDDNDDDVFFSFLSVVLDTIHSRQRVGHYWGIPGYPSLYHHHPRRSGQVFVYLGSSHLPLDQSAVQNRVL